MEIFLHDIRIHVDYYYAYTLLILILSNSCVNFSITVCIKNYCTAQNKRLV